MNAKEIIDKASTLVAGDRQKTHGDKGPNHENIAALWNAYLLGKPGYLTSLDVALMMALVKIARTKLGAHNADNYIDLAGYAGVAGEIAELKNALAKSSQGEDEHDSYGDTFKTEQRDIGFIPTRSLGVTSGL